MDNKVWLKSYPKNMPAEIDADQYSSLPQMLEEVFSKFSARPAFHNLSYSMAYAELDRLSRNFAAYLQNLPGMSQGDRVAIISPNLLQYPVVLFGILRAGMTVVNVNPLCTPRELAHQLADSGAKAIVIVENFAPTLEAVVADTAVEHVITTQIGDLLSIPKRWLINFVIKRVNKMGPSWHIDGAIPLREALDQGALAPLKPVKLSG